MKVYQNTAFGSYLSLGKLQDEPESPLAYYTVLINFEQDCTLLKDEVPLVVPAHSIACFSPDAHVQLEAPFTGEHCVVSFNRSFYCVELHDKETSCNGLLFNGVLGTPIIYMSKREQQKFNLLMEVFKDEFEEEDNVQADMLELLLKRLIIKSARLFKEQIRDEKSLEIQDTDLVREFSALVEKHFRQKHKVADYADLMNKAPKTLSNLFIQYAGRTPLQIIHDRIVLEAKRLLHYTDKTSKEIAFELGFDDPALFNRFFKKHTETTPSSFKKTAKIG